MAKLGILLRGAKGKLAGTTIYKGANGTVMREVVTPSNPSTEAQRIQRAIYRTACKSYQYMKAIADHSFQGQTRPNKNQARFMSLNLAYLRKKVSDAQQAGLINNCVNFYPKGMTSLLPVDCIISEGSLPQIKTNIQERGANFAGCMVGFVPTGSVPTYQEVLSFYNLRRGDQITFVVIASAASGGWSFDYARIILDPRYEDGTPAPLTTQLGGGANPRDEGYLSFEKSESGLLFAVGEDWPNIASAGVIVSRKSNNSWERSNCRLAFSDYAAVDTYSIVDASAEAASPIVTQSDQYLNEAESDSSTNNIGTDEPTITGIYIKRTAADTLHKIPLSADNSVSVNGGLNTVVIKGSNLAAADFTLDCTTGQVVSFSASGADLEAQPEIVAGEYANAATILKNGVSLGTIFINEAE
ncbi:MAG: hypothetical protein LIR46_11525 [Bacteroidota bacterium]|nr:hypothetical protein [Bacteroidota bacterium]